MEIEENGLCMVSIIVCALHLTAVPVFAGIDEKLFYQHETIHRVPHSRNLSCQMQNRRSIDAIITTPNADEVHQVGQSAARQLFAIETRACRGQIPNRFQYYFFHNFSPRLCTSSLPCHPHCARECISSVLQNMRECDLLSTFSLYSLYLCTQFVVARMNANWIFRKFFRAKSRRCTEIERRSIESKWINNSIRSTREAAMLPERPHVRNVQ